MARYTHNERTGSTANDSVQHAVEIGQNLVVLKTKSANAVFMEFDLSIKIGFLTVVRCVTRAIQFDRQLCLGTEEIDNSTVDRMLSTKLQIGDVAIAQL